MCAPVIRPSAPDVLRRRDAVGLDEIPTGQLNIAQAESGRVREAQLDAMEPGAVLETARAPDPVHRPPVARAPGVVALAGGLSKLELLVAHAHRAGHAAGNLVAGRDAVGVRLAVRLPRQVERDGHGVASLSAQGRGLVVVRLAGRVERDAEPLERRFAHVVGLEPRAVDVRSPRFGQRRLRSRRPRPPARPGRHTNAVYQHASRFG